MTVRRPADVTGEHATRSCAPLLVPCGFAQVGQPEAAHGGAREHPRTPLASPCSTRARRSRSLRAGLCAVGGSHMAGITGVGDERRSWRTVAVPVTSALDGLEHLVANAAMAPGTAGRYVALCEHRLWAAALSCPPGRRCPACVAVYNGGDVADGPRHRRSNRCAPWARLIGLLGHLRPVRAESPLFPEVTVPLSGLVGHRCTRGSGNDRHE